MISVVIGTRPEIIKMAPVLREIVKRELPFELVHSNQHYSAELDEIFLKQLNLPPVSVNLQIGSGSHARQVADLLIKVEDYCLSRRPSVVMVHGDTNTTLGATLAAAKLNIPVAHVEAGLRSGDMSMPEEQNRIVVDHVSDCLFAPTAHCQKNLFQENISKKKVFLTGNTIADALRQHMPMTEFINISDIVSNVADGDYILVTAHRPANVDEPEQLMKLIKLISKVAEEFEKMIVWPIHPRTQLALERSQLVLGSNIKIIKPVGYLEMLKLMNNSWAILTDSGGVQEEAYLLQKPLITLRDNTERPETLSANVLVGLNVKKTIVGLRKLLLGDVVRPPTLGDGYAAERIITTAEKYLK